MAFARQWRRALAVFLFVLFFVAAISAAVLLSYFLAARLTITALLALSSVLCFALLMWLGAWISGRVWRASRPSRFAAATAGAFTLLFAAAIYFAILRPHPLRLAEVPPYENTRYWQLPTGSRIAYSEYDPPVGVTVKPDPIVFVHGGPGLRQAPFDQDAYAGFAADGFRVILYDQAGSGLSGFLPHVRDYTIPRAVDDLEAIRQELHADRMILIGHSWGSTLAASYMARYPDHVSKVVFHSPARIWNIPQDPIEFSRTDGGDQALPPTRMLAAFFLQVRNPDSAENLLPQREAEELFAPAMLPSVGTLVCKGDLGKLPPVFAEFRKLQDNPGFNPYVLQGMVLQTENPAADPHAALRNNHTPAILLFGECNYLPWAGAIDYRNTLPNLKIYYIPRAGHFIQFEQPELMHHVIRVFLLDQPDAIPPHTSDADPRTVHP